MNEAGQHWARRGAEAERDMVLASFVAGGALMLWDAESGRLVHANAVGRALAGGDDAWPGLPEQTRRRLALLAGGLAPQSGLRLERLRLTTGFAALPATCGCRLLIETDAQPVLAIAVPASELRRIGVAVRPPESVAAIAPVEAASEPAAPSPAPARRSTVRFVWQSDADGRLSRLSPNIAELVGAETAQALPGRSWSELLGQDVIDRTGGLIERLATPETWSGHDVLWRVPSTGDGARVELSGAPVLDAGRRLAGFRGFGIAHLDLLEAFPAIAPIVADEAAVPDAPPALASDEVRAPLSEAFEPGAAPRPPVDEAREDVPAEPPAEAAPADLRTQAEETDVEQEETEAEAASVPEQTVEPAAKPEIAAPVAGDNIVTLRGGPVDGDRPVPEAPRHLSSAERNAFREIAKALGARIASEDEGVAALRLPPVAPLQIKPADTPPPSSGEPAPRETRRRLPNSHADILDRLPTAVLVNRGEQALYANRTLLDLLDYADLDDLEAAGGVSRMIKGAARAEGGPMTLIDRLGAFVRVEAVLSSVNWQGEPATLMAFRHHAGGGEAKVLTPEEAEEEELAAEFAAEEAESAARVEALRLDVDVRESRIAELTAMLDTATDGVVTIDERGRILSLNKTAEALFGYDQREVTGELFTLLFAAESHAPALDYLEGLKGGGVASVMNDGREVVGRVRQGGKIPLFMTMGQIAHGHERRFCAVLRDITAWKKTEGELVEARKTAEKASAQKSDVLAKISHEIRTPLNAIIGFAEVMAEERFGPIANERYKEYLRDIHQSGGYVISLVNDLLDLAKIEAGKLDLDFVSVNLNEIALSAVALLQPEAQRGKVVLRSGLSPKLPPVVADERSIRQIVINLLSNAVKFTDAGGQVIVSTALGDQGEAILRVRDTGIGMDDEEIKLALEPFRQVPATRRAGGTGLGLPLTKALIEANRAAMSITSVKREGTLVEVTFPPQRVLAG